MDQDQCSSQHLIISNRQLTQTDINNSDKLNPESNTFTSNPPENNCSTHNIDTRENFAEIQAVNPMCYNEVLNPGSPQSFLQIESEIGSHNPDKSKMESDSYIPQKIDDARSNSENSGGSQKPVSKETCGSHGLRDHESKDTCGSRNLNDLKKVPSCSGELNKPKADQSLTTPLQLSPKNKEKVIANKILKKAKKNSVSENMERMNYLVQSSADAAGMDDVSSVLGRRALSIGKKTVTRLSSSLKRVFCKACGLYLEPGITARFRHRTKRQKHLVITCLNCNTVKRFVTDQNYTLWNDKPESRIS